MSGGPCLVVIDDNPGDIELVKIAYEMRGVVIALLSAEGGEAALALLTHMEREGRKPSLILLDLNMPRVNGFDVLKFLSVRAAYSRVPIIVLTSSNAPADHARALALGARELVAKPEGFNDYLLLVDRFSPHLVDDSHAAAES